MLENREGNQIPDVTFLLRGAHDWVRRSSEEIFSGRTVVVFSLPGAFTPTCSSSHVPRYQELLPDLQAAGVDEVACVSVNDAFVMQAWQVDQGAPGITFLADGNGSFTEKMGMLVDKSEIGFGKRSWRYSMLVRDGVVEKMFVEPEVPGDPFEVSDADTMLAYLAPQAEVRDVVLFGREGCSHCARARKLLEEAGIPFVEAPASPRLLRATTGRTSTPQIFVDGAHIGGADELESHLSASAEPVANL